MASVSKGSVALFTLGLVVGCSVIYFIFDFLPSRSFPDFMMIERDGNEIMWAETREWQYAFGKNGEAYIAFPLQKPKGSKNPFESKGGNHGLS